MVERTGPGETRWSDRAGGATHLDDDGCLDLVAGLLSAPEREAALAHAETCEACAARIVRWAGYQECARLGRTEESIGKEPAFAPVSPDGRRRRVVSWRRTALWWLPLAAGFLLWLGREPSRPPATSTPASHAAPWIAQHPAWRRLREGTGGKSAPAGAAVPEALRQAIRHYDARRPAAAARLLAASRFTGGAEDLRVLYLASCLVHMDRPAEAENLLETLDIGSLPPPWRDAARRTLAAARKAQR